MDIEPTLLKAQQRHSVSQSQDDGTLKPQGERHYDERIVSAVTHLQETSIPDPLQHITMFAETFDIPQMLARSYVAADTENGLFLTRSRGKRKSGRDPYYTLFGNGLSIRFTAPNEEAAIQAARHRRNRHFEKRSGKKQSEKSS